MKFHLHRRRKAPNHPGFRETEPASPGKIVEIGLLALLVFSPLPAASVGAWAVFVIEIAAIALTAVYVLMTPKPSVNSHLEAAMKWPNRLFVAFFAFLIFQIVPLPGFLVGFLSPGAVAFREQFVPRFADLSFFSLSLVPAKTFREILELLSCVLIGYLVLRTITRGRQIRRMIAVLVGMGVFEAFYGLYELSTKNPRILFYKKVFSPHSVTGTFVNRSHLSGYLEMIVPLAIGLLIARLDFFDQGGEGFKEKFLRMSGRDMGMNLLLVAAVIVMSLGIVFSNSRAGVFSLVFTFILFVEFLFLHYGRFGPRRIWIRNLILGLFILVTASALYIGVGTTIQRFSLDRLLQENRPLYWGNVAQIVSSFPVFGSGFGTFVSVYPAFEKTTGPELLLVHAHNDFLEYLSEVGIIGFLLILGAILFPIIKSFLVWKKRRNPEIKGIVLGGLISLIVILIHSLTDFNLHIPANMVLFSVVLSLTFVAAFYRKA